MKNRCPICGKIMDTKSYGSDYGSSIEEYNTCKICGYVEEFVYGHYRIGFYLEDYESKLSLAWSYSKPPSVTEFKRFKKAMYGYRRCLLKKHIIKTLGNMKF